MTLEKQALTIAVKMTNMQRFIFQDAVRHPMSYAGMGWDAADDLITSDRKLTALGAELYRQL